jgi:hypothetical protein
MASVKSFFKLTYNIFTFPALLLHELWHLIAALCVGGKIHRIKFHSLKRATLYVNNLDKPLKVRIVAMSPLMSLLIAALSPLFIGTDMLYFSFYYLLTINTSVPSYLDFYVADLRPPSFYRHLFGQTYKEYQQEKEIEATYFSDFEEIELPVSSMLK